MKFSSRTVGKRAVGYRELGHSALQMEVHHLKVPMVTEGRLPYTSFLLRVCEAVSGFGRKWFFENLGFKSFFVCLVCVEKRLQI